nr:maltose O-acetyltransferase [Cryptococcus depauperatus CBS 7841]
MTAAPHLTNKLIPPPEGDEDPSQLALMIDAKRYFANDKYLDRLRNTGAIKLDEITRVADYKKRMALWREFADVGEDVFITQRFFCEYVSYQPRRARVVRVANLRLEGFNLHFAGRNFIGANCTFSDVCPIYIGERSMVGPDVKIYTPEHPLSSQVRADLADEEWGKSVRIEEDCWICGSVIILPGVTIGRGSTVGAGSVVTKDVPPQSVAIGNPARVVKKILEDGTVVKV